MTQLVGGPPGASGAQTSAGGWWGGSGLPIPPVGSYPQTVSPWGLLDTSGGEDEWTDTASAVSGLQRRYIRGDHLNSQSFSERDHLDYLFTTGSAYGGGLIGLRIASLVPGVSSTSALGFAIAFTGRRRRRTM